MATDMAHNLGAFVDKGGEVSKQFRDLIAEGRKVTATEYLAAVRDARRYADGMGIFSSSFADAIVTLSARGVAPQGHRSDRRSGILHALDPDRTSRRSICRLLANADGLPIGVQLVGARWTR